MNWLEFIPPIYSILTIGLSAITASGLRERVGRFVANTSYAPQEDVIINIALSWEAYVNFFNFVIGAAISIFAILSRVQSFNWAAGLVMPLLVVVVAMVHFLGKFEVDQIESRVVMGRIRPIHICNLVLLLSNFLLIAATYGSQVLNPVPPKASKTTLGAAAPSTPSGSPSGHSAVPNTPGAPKTK